MKSAILILAVLVVRPLWAATITDDFNRASLGTNWSAGYFDTSDRDCQTDGSAYAEQTIVGSTCFETWNANSFTGDQTASIVIQSLSNAAQSSASILLKASAPTTFTGYMCRAMGGDSQAKTRIARVDSGVYTALTLENTISGWDPGDVLKCVVSGTKPQIVRAYKNGALILTHVENTSELSGSRIGISCYTDPALQLNECQIDSFSGGDYTPTAVVRRAIVVE